MKIKSNYKQNPFYNHRTKYFKNMRHILSFKYLFLSAFFVLFFSMILVYIDVSGQEKRTGYVDYNKLRSEYSPLVEAQHKFVSELQRAFETFEQDVKEKESAYYIQQMEKNINPEIIHIEFENLRKEYVHQHMKNIRSIESEYQESILPYEDKIKKAIQELKIELYYNDIQPIDKEFRKSGDDDVTVKLLDKLNK
jgi:hypothetical protein